MNSLMLSLLAVLCVAGMCVRPPSPDDKTPAQAWEPARAKGWRRGALLGLGGLVKMLLLVVAGVVLVSLVAASHFGRGIAVVCAALGWRLKAAVAYAACPPRGIGPAPEAAA